VVGADGSLSRVRRSLQWPESLPLARTLEVVHSVDPAQDPDYSCNRMSFDFSAVTTHRLQGYTWDFPTALDGRPAVNRGVFDSRVWPKRRRPRLKEVLAAVAERSGCSICDYPLKSAPIRWWDGRARVSAERVLLAGDAAGTDPLFGEGISFSLSHGQVAAEVLHRAFGQGDLRFADYRERLLEHPVVGQIPTRRLIARIGYRLRSPLIVGAIWLGVGLLVPNIEAAGRAWRLFARIHRTLGGVRTL
jgi:flavin-dependent dehydrogenase